VVGPRIIRELAQGLVADEVQGVAVAQEFRHAGGPVPGIVNGWARWNGVGWRENMRTGIILLVRDLGILPFASRSLAKYAQTQYR
jgi:hypothetical protein